MSQVGIGPGGIVTDAPLRIYTGILGQIGDIIMFTATARRLKELFPNSELTFAVSRRYQEAGELVAGLSYVDRLFVSELYFEKLSTALFYPWEFGWPVELRGEDEVREQWQHDLVLQTRPRHQRQRWWEHAHQVEETAQMVGVPGPIDCRTDVAIPADTWIWPEAQGKIVIHNDPNIDATKAWSWDALSQFVIEVGPEQVALVGGPGPELPGVLDLRGHTTLAQAAAIIRDCQCYVGIDSGLMWIAGSLQIPVVGLYGTSYIPAYGAIQPVNPRAIYIQVEGSPATIECQAVLDAVAVHLN